MGGLCGQVSIATEDCAIVVVVFDRAARSLFGCSANEFLQFASQTPFAGTSHERDRKHDTLSELSSNSTRLLVRRWLLWILHLPCLVHFGGMLGGSVEVSM